MNSKSSSVSFSVVSETSLLTSFEQALADLDNRQTKKKFVGQFKHDLITAFTEGVANTIRHAHELKRFKKIECLVKISRRIIEIQIFDHGRGFDLKKIRTPQFERLDESGRGIFMMRQLMDSVEYKKGKNKNTLILKRELIGAGQEAQVLNLFHEVSDAILKTSDLKTVYNIILEKAVSVFKVERASILIYDKKSKRLKVAASLGMAPTLTEEISVRPGEGISGYVFQHAKPCLIEDMTENQSGWTQQKHYKSRSFISAPMIDLTPAQGAGAREAPEGHLGSIGVMNMTDRMNGKSFTKKDLKILTTLANQASVCLHLVNLIHKAGEAENFRRELEIARRIHNTYLPLQAPFFDTLDMSGYLETAQSVGGDYYDFIITPHGDLYVVLADVSGHNMAAAMTMANVRAHLRALLLYEKDPGKILENLNAILYADLERSDQFVSMLLIRFRKGSNQVDIANAGHRYPLLMRGGMEREVSFPEAGAVLGALLPESYISFSFDLVSNDWVILYTDGVTEALSPRGDRFGFERLVSRVKENSENNSKNMVDAINCDLKLFRQEIAISDDATIVSIKKI